MSLRHHLRTDKHITLTAGKAAQNIFVGKLGDSRILVHTQHAHLRQRFQLLLRLLRRKELAERNFSVLSRRLQQALVTTAAAGEQAIVLLNRRGYSTFVMCRDCGQTSRAL